MKNKLSIISALGFVTIALLLPFSSAHAIKKCKDADGKWHYGDLAVRACERSKITTLNDRGFIESEKSAPKTDEELKAEEEARILVETQEKRIKAEEDERDRILSVYETEADIDRQRDNQINSVESNIAVHKSYLKAMDAKVARFEEDILVAKGAHKANLTKGMVEAKARIKDSGLELQELVKQKEQIMQKFEREKEIYLSLKENDGS